MRWSVGSYHIQTSECNWHCSPSHGVNTCMDYTNPLGGFKPFDWLKGEEAV